MKSLIEQSQELAGQIDRIINRESEIEVAQSLTVVAENVANRVHECLSLKSHLTTMAAAGIMEKQTGPSTAQINSLIKKIESVRKRHKENRANLRQGNTWVNCDNEAGALNKELKASLTASWRRYINENLTDTSSFNTFRQVPDCSVVFKQVDASNRDIEALLPVLPTTPQELELIVSKSKSARKAISGLKLEGVPTAVQSFLKKSSTGGVPMSELSDDVLTWLRSNEKFMVALRINASSP